MAKQKPAPPAMPSEPTVEDNEPKLLDTPIIYRNGRGDEFKFDGIALTRKMHTDDKFYPFLGNTTEQYVETFLAGTFEGEYQRVEDENG